MADGPCGALYATGTGDLDATGDGCSVPRGPGRYNIYVYQGDAWRRTIVWEDPAGTPAANLTDAVIKLQVRRGPIDTDPTELFSASVGDGITITDGVNATFTVLLSPAKTVLLVGSVPYMYDLEVTPSGGDKTTILRGFVYFDLEVSR